VGVSADDKETLDGARKNFIARFTKYGFLKWHNGKTFF
jgi:hypothetical protein